MKAIKTGADIQEITHTVGPFFVIASALFLPCAFNRLKSIFTEEQ